MASATAGETRRMVRDHPIIATAALGLGLRLLWLLLGTGRDRWLIPDSLDYLDLSNRLGAYAGDGGGASGPLQLLTLYRPPVYPAFVWLTSFGHPERLLTVVLAQIILGGLVNVALSYRLGRLLGGRRVGAVAALLVAVDPSSVAHSLLIASETITTTLVLVALVALAEARERSAVRARVGLAAVAGLAIALSTVTRPLLLYVVPLLAVVALFAPRPAGDPAPDRSASEPSPRRRHLSYAMALAVLAGAVIPVGAWFARNQSLTGRAIYSTVQGENLTLYGLGAVAAERGEIRLQYDLGPGNLGATVVPDEELVRRVDRRAIRALGADPDAVDPGLRSTPEYAAAADRALSAEGLRMLRDHPRGAVILGGYGIGRMMLAPGASGNLAQLRPGLQVAPIRALVWAWAIGWLALVDLGAVVGLVTVLRRRMWWAAALLAVPTAYYLAASAGTFAYLRFRIPISPLLCVLASFAIVAAMDARRPAEE